MGVKKELETAKKELEDAKKQLESAKGTLDSALKATDTALKSFEDKKKAAGGGIKKLSATIDGLKKIIEKAPFNQAEALKLIQVAGTSAAETEKAAGAD